MAYNGEILNACGVIQADFKTTYVIAVSGDGINKCGHLLIYSTGGGGYYFHAVGDPAASGFKKMRGFPMYMDENGYRRYLKENGKTELKRRYVELTNPAGALQFVETTLSEQWTWAVLPHNCVSFVEGLISAGGGDWGSYSNCPRLATAQTISEKMQEIYFEMDRGIKQIYGVPSFGF